MIKIDNIVEEAKSALGTNLTSILVTGTAAIPEDFVEGISDYDIALVVKDKSKSVKEAISALGKSLSLTDDFQINVITEDQARDNRGLWAFSDKFRTKCVFGKDLVSHVNLPSTDESKSRLLTYIKIHENRLFNRSANFSFWSEPKIKKEAYKLAKHILFSYSIYYFLRNGNFLRNRREIYENGSQAAKQLSVLLYHWKRVQKDHVIESIPFMLEVVNEIREFCSST